jgi:hypothetical protein
MDDTWLRHLERDYIIQNDPSPKGGVPFDITTKALRTAMQAVRTCHEALEALWKAARALQQVHMAAMTVPLSTPEAYKAYARSVIEGASETGCTEQLDAWFTCDENRRARNAAGMTSDDTAEIANKIKEAVEIAAF